MKPLISDEMMSVECVSGPGVLDSHERRGRGPQRTETDIHLTRSFLFYNRP